jgi:hypothetical protein
MARIKAALHLLQHLLNLVDGIFGADTYTFTALNAILMAECSPFKIMR